MRGLYPVADVFPPEVAERRPDVVGAERRAYVARRSEFESAEDIASLTAWMDRPARASGLVSMSERRGATSTGVSGATGSEPPLTGEPADNGTGQ